MPYKSAEDNVTIYVPAGSTTATTLNKLASTLKNKEQSFYETSLSYAMAAVAVRH